MSTNEPIPRSPLHEKSCTIAGYKFQRRHYVIFDFFFFNLKIASAADKARLKIFESLAITGGEAEKKRWEEVRESPHQVFVGLRLFAEYQTEIMIIRSVDNFLSMLSETLQACMLKRPEMLRSAEQIKTEDVLRFTKRSEIIEFIVNQKVNQLSYGGFRALEVFFDRHLGVALMTDAERESVSVAIELRNIYTHNRGVVNELFLSRLKGVSADYDFREGKRFHTDFDQIVRIANALFDVAVRVDGAVSHKYGLKRKRYATWDAPRAKAEMEERKEFKLSNVFADPGRKDEGAG